MLAPFLAVLLFPSRDRASFNAAMARVQNGMVESQVQAILGPPDEVWEPKNGFRYVSEDERIWCYGNAGPFSLPVLGKVRFYRGKTFEISHLEPIPNLPTETVLVPLLRTMDQRTASRPDIDPIRLIRSANALRRLPKMQILATMIQFDRLGGALETTFWLMDLSRILFREDNPKPAYNDRTEEGKRNRAWPNLSFLLVDDIPFLLPKGPIGGYFPPFEYYAKEICDNWSVKREDLRPPNDPFPSYFKAIEMAHQSDAEVHFPGGNQFDQTIQASLFSLISDGPYYALNDSKEMQEAHHQFLIQGKKWDSQQQAYR